MALNSEGASLVYIHFIHHFYELPSATITSQPQYGADWYGDLIRRSCTSLHTRSKVQIHKPIQCLHMFVCVILSQRILRCMLQEQLVEMSYNPSFKAL